MKTLKEILANNTIQYHLTNGYDEETSLRNVGIIQDFLITNTPALETLIELAYKMGAADTETAHHNKRLPRLDELWSENKHKYL